VIVYEKGEETVVSAFDPMVMSTILETPEVQPIADEVKKRLERVIAGV
jgi:hypothetical protein